MAIPELEIRRVEKLLHGFCEERVPPHARHQIELLFRRRGNAITLFERRPYFRDPSRHVECPIARFVYLPADNRWQLQWCDRNDRWHAYDGFERVESFEALLEEVDRDPTGIFWG